MANVNSVNGNSNSAAVEQAAELNKQNAEKTAELNKQNAEKAAEAASKTDTVKISTAAQSASSSSSNANTNSGSNANANASSNSNDNEDSTSLSKKRRSGRHSRSNSSRYSSNNSSRYDRSSRSDKAERSSKADSKGLRISSSRNDRKVEHSGRHTSSTEKVNNRDRTSGSKRGGRFDASMLKVKTEKLSNAFKGLSKMGVSSKEVSKIMKSANRSMNEKLGNDLKQAYSDYKDKKISGDEFKSKLYESAIKKVQGIASALQSNFMQKPAFGADNSGSTTPSFAAKANDNGPTTPSFATKANDNGSSTMSFAKKDDAQTSSAPRTSIFDKKESATSTPTPLEKSMAKKDEPSLAEKAMAANKEKMEEAKAAAGKDGLSIVDKATAKNKEKSEGAKAAAKTDEKTAMEAKPAISQDAKITEKKGNIAKDVGDHLHTTTEKSVENSALKTGKTDPGEKGPKATPPGLEKKDDDDKTVAEGPKPTPPGLEKKEEGAIPPGLAKNEGPEAVPPGQAKKDDDAAADISKMEKELKKLLEDIIKKAEKLPPGLAKKDEVPGNADKAFEEIVSMFTEMDKMVNGLGKEDGAEEDKGFGDFVSGLKGMFNSGNGVEGNSFLKNLNKVSDEHGASAAHKVGMETIKAETLSGLLKGGSTNSAFGVNSVGDNGDGSGNYSAVNFMSDMSNNSS